MEELGNLAWLATILADQVPKFHFKLCWVGRTIGQELNWAGSQGLDWLFMCLVQHIFWRPVHGYQHKTCHCGFFYKIALLFKEPGSFIIGRILSGF